MASPTEEKVAEQRDEVANLRKEVAAAEVERADQVAERTREIESARLDREKVRLEARLTSRQSSVDNPGAIPQQASKGGTAAPGAPASAKSTPTGTTNPGDDKKE